MFKCLSTLFLMLAALSVASSPAAAQRLTPPADVAAARSPNTAGAVELSWHAVPGASAYAISASRETEDSWQLLTTTTATAFRVDELPEGTRYFFRIASRRGESQSGWSRAVMQSASAGGDFGAGPALPHDLRVATLAGTPHRPGELTLTWSAVPRAAAYVVQICDTQRCDAGRSGRYGSFSDGEWFRDLSRVTSPGYVARGLQTGTRYTFRIAAVGADGTRGGPGAVFSQIAP